VVACAGKERKIVGAAPVTILGPSEQIEQQKELRVGVEGVARAHHDWESGVVDTPMLAGSVVGSAYLGGANGLGDTLMPVASVIDQPPAYTGPKV
jgi:hypothetical protein